MYGYRQTLGVSLGVQLGISYTPDTGNQGTADGFTTDSDAGLNLFDSNDMENFVGLGMNTIHMLAGPWTVQTSLIAEFGQSEHSGFEEDIAAWSAGIVLGHGAFSLAGSYARWDEGGGYHIPPNILSSDSNVVTATTCRSTRC